MISRSLHAIFEESRTTRTLEWGFIWSNLSNRLKAVPDTHDSTVFDNSHLRAVLENEVPSEYHLVGDNGYGCRSYLLTPFLDPSTPQEIRYNVAHKAARNVFERQYGVMKRFACLATSLQNAMTVIVAVLHNMALQMDDIFEEEDDDRNNPTVANHAAGLAKRNALLSTFFNN
ncbi:hypothetical protein AVEN_146661-1 [Araneus ventricosus]|uniref:DDE Tnp4 domain-containing protein n=1 Tax=Araneus ventricosus TaxID=182803 RepID=A0A4Y2KMF5_ARAVE|nr:hypothetical protein AVEN_146661-1 [Araneus ventricosus]